MGIQFATFKYTKGTYKASGLDKILFFQATSKRIKLTS